ncbi:bifunctional arginine demethylase and lysyl-hydroxylase psr-1-like isoform X1 [Hydractinia symbiolongicarpus]|uniref:bifunctional arginine demethylase and lysyl-hydroxylase psr-1-like isoform X1 n=1 Tax=Hydractinia symbiolongicarpus TaxID=13093 RepID=UPI00255010AD|nr:bifunctional arginine demethylase and lysyl-hydroxylase psr-1-like isoform X1 [Hydractinia symbiolongicarpus]XP_057306512.1 bifunctional arginine demethylase and lysyl-hydroxylase psr-1-like isoform X1 [Hydractinia symbiolongicarpus]
MMQEQVGTLIEISLKSGLSVDEILAVLGNEQIAELKFRKKPFDFYSFILTSCMIVLLLALVYPNLYENPKGFISQIQEEYTTKREAVCLIPQSALTLELTRPLAKCSFCDSLTQIPVIENVSKDYFLNHHAYTRVPVLVKNAVSNWSALTMFTFRYFQKLYDKLEAYDENEDMGCQFFPYKTNFKSLKQVLHMSKKRSELQKDQWYIGWSNCVPRVMKSLRKHYHTPHFLPDDSESSHLDWMFMGGSGTGADMHIDAVNRPSWQAMIRGRKTWFFEPPPECEHVCKRHLNVTMEPGDILVADTNRWYHATYIHPGNLSITIGSEFD